MMRSAVERRWKGCTSCLVGANPMSPWFRGARAQMKREKRLKIPHRFGERKWAGAAATRAVRNNRECSIITSQSVTEHSLAQPQCQRGEIQFWLLFLQEGSRHLDEKTSLSKALAF